MWKLKWVNLVLFLICQSDLRVPKNALKTFPIRSPQRKVRRTSGRKCKQNTFIQCRFWKKPKFGNHDRIFYLLILVYIKCFCSLAAVKNGCVLLLLNPRLDFHYKMKLQCLCYVSGIEQKSVCLRSYEIKWIKIIPPSLKIVYSQTAPFSFTGLENLSTLNNFCTPKLLCCPTVFFILNCMRISGKQLQIT